MNHARRLAEDDWAGVESDDEGREGEDAEEEAMDVDAGKKLPKRYANQVRSRLCRRGEVWVWSRNVGWFEATVMSIWRLRGMCPARLGAHGETVINSPPKHARFQWKTRGDGMRFRITWVGRDLLGR